MVLSLKQRGVYSIYLDHGAVIHLRAIRKSDSSKFIELCMETLCWCASRWHQHGGSKVTETSVIEFCLQNESFITLEL